MTLRIPADQWASFQASMLDRQDVETAGAIFAEPQDAADGPILLVRSLVRWPEDGYLDRRPDHISLSPVTINQMTKIARDRGWSLLTAHTHPGADAAGFSKADDLGDRRLMPGFERLMPGRPHGSLVLSSTGRACARLSLGGGFTPIRVITVGEGIRVLSDLGSEDDERFQRQVLALGAAGQRRIRALRVAVVGLGGIGSMVALNLAHLGIGTLVLLDGDRIDRTNLSRVSASSPDDIGRLKVDVARAYIDRCGLPITVITLGEHLEGERQLRQLRSCDLIMCCVDRQVPRALLNRLAYDSGIPLIDHGTAFRVDEGGQIISDAGRVVVLGPGKPCLACWGHLNPEILREESLPAVAREHLRKEGYLQGAAVEEPSVIPFNTMVAGAGVIEALRIMTGFAGATPGPRRLEFSFREGRVRRNALAGDDRCRLCSLVNQVPGNVISPVP